MPRGIYVSNLHRNLIYYLLVVKGESAQEIFEQTFGSKEDLISYRRIENISYWIKNGNYCVLRFTKEQTLIKPKFKIII
jgi:hypothetical protein